MSIRQLRTSLLCLVVAAGLPVGDAAADWPQWRGPGRDGRLVGGVGPEAWSGALAPRWSREVGIGHASPVVVGDRVFVFARQGEEETMQALDLASGEILWRDAYAAPYTMNPAARSHGKGPKSTPVAAEGRVCAFGIGGILSCWASADGTLAWRQDLSGTYPQTSPLYGAAVSPVVDAGRLIVHVGGPGNGALTAFDLADGDVLWAWDGDGPGYASPVVAEIGGTRQVITFSESQFVGVSAEDGTLLWSVTFTTPYVQNAVTPVVADDLVIYSGLEQPVRAARVVRGPDGWALEPEWENEEVAAYMSTPVLAGGRLFGFSHRKRGQLFALDAASGETLWLSDGRLGDNAALLADETRLLALTNGAELIVQPRAADAFEPVWRDAVADTPTWAHPVLTGAGLLVKDESHLTLLGFAAEHASIVTDRDKGADMNWIVFVVGAVLSWGLYGPMIHKGQVALGNPLRAFLFVGLAYFLVGVLAPLASLVAQGELRGFSSAGIMTSLLAGCLGAAGALCVIYSFRAGGSPLWVMPLVFGGAPLVNVLYSLWAHPPKTAPSPMLYVGFLLAAAGAYMVLHYKPAS